MEGTMNWSGKVRDSGKDKNPKNIIPPPKLKKDKDKGKHEETYTICFTQDGQTFSYDPIIKVDN
jgi:hypothetical protein